MKCYLDSKFIYAVLIFTISFVIYRFFDYLLNKETRNHYKVKREVVLQGRIYPTLLQLVQNRYYILTSYIASLAFILFNPSIREYFQNGLLLLLYVFFWLAVISHNLFNYLANAIEKGWLEGDKTSYRMEVWFYFFMVFLIILSCVLLFGGD